MIDLSFDRVSKKYCIQPEIDRALPQPGLARSLRRLTRRGGNFWALLDVSFRVLRGETLGIIGANGAGKSTILKLLSRITAPTTGEITINGRLSALIEIGSGFHPELTGRENVYLCGSILGMRRREIAEKRESIIEFAGVRQFIDTPVKHYSSGMCVRLGFSIAAHLQSDILLLDEVLAVGDATFQEKCFKRITELKENGTTIVFISHDLNAVDFVCDRVILLSEGKIAAEGLPREVISEYEESQSVASVYCRAPFPTRDCSSPVRIVNLTFLDYEGRHLAHTLTGNPLVTRLEFETAKPVEDIVFEIYFYSLDAKLQCQYSTSLGHERIDLDRGKGVVEFSNRELGLQPGTYYVDATVKRRSGDQELDWQYRCALLHVSSGKSLAGRFYAPHDWRIMREQELSPRFSAQRSQIASGD